MGPHHIAVLLLGLSGACQICPCSEPVYEEDFGSPGALEDFVFSDASSWQWTELEEQGALELSGSCDYSPPQHSPRALALLAEHEVGSFTLDVEVQQTGEEYGHRDLCLFFGWHAPDRYYYVHLATAPDDRAHNIFVVDGAPRVRLAEVGTQGVDWGTGVWHRLSLQRNSHTGLVRVYFDDLDTPVLEAYDSRFARGRVGFGSFDDTGRMRWMRLHSHDAERVPPPEEPFPRPTPE